MAKLYQLGIILLALYEATSFPSIPDNENVSENLRSHCDSICSESEAKAKFDDGASICFCEIEKDIDGVKASLLLKKANEMGLFLIFRKTKLNVPEMNEDLTDIVEEEMPFLTNDSYVPPKSPIITNKKYHANTSQKLTDKFNAHLPDEASAIEHAVSPQSKSNSPKAPNTKGTQSSSPTAQHQSFSESVEHFSYTPDELIANPLDMPTIDEISEEVAAQMTGIIHTIFDPDVHENTLKAKREIADKKPSETAPKDNEKVDQKSPDTKDVVEKRKPLIVDGSTSKPQAPVIAVKKSHTTAAPKPTEAANAEERASITTKREVVNDKQASETVAKGIAASDKSSKDSSSPPKKVTAADKLKLKIEAKTKGSDKSDAQDAVDEVVGQKAPSIKLLNKYTNPSGGKKASGLSRRTYTAESAKAILESAKQRLENLIKRTKQSTFNANLLGVEVDAICAILKPLSIRTADVTKTVDRSSIIEHIKEREKERQARIQSRFGGHLDMPKKYKSPIVGLANAKNDVEGTRLKNTEQEKVSRPNVKIITQPPELIDE